MAFRAKLLVRIYPGRGSLYADFVPYMYLILQAEKFLQCDHTCPVLSIRFQWTNPGVQWSLVEELNQKYSRVHLSYQKSSNKMKLEV